MDYWPQVPHWDSLSACVGNQQARSTAAQKMTTNLQSNQKHIAAAVSILDICRPDLQCRHHFSINIDRNQSPLLQQICPKQELKHIHQDCLACILCPRPVIAIDTAAAQKLLRSGAAAAQRYHIVMYMC